MSDRFGRLPFMPNEPRYAMIVSDEPQPMGDTLREYARPLIDKLPPDHTGHPGKDRLGAVYTRRALRGVRQRRASGGSQRDRCRPVQTICTRKLPLRSETAPIKRQVILRFSEEQHRGYRGRANCAKFPCQRINSPFAGADCRRALDPTPTHV
jgi:hypothetical protein